MASESHYIAHALTVSLRLLSRYVEDLKPEEYLHRPCAGANCAAWLLGHLILSERRAMGRLGVADLPVLPDGFETRFARDETAPKAGEYGDVSLLMPLFARHRELLIERVNAMTAEQLNEPVEQPHPMFKTVGEVASFMAQHATLHAGQITIIRRSLGRPPLM